MVDVKALEATAEPVKDAPKGLAMIGNIDNANDNFNENTKKTSPAALAAAKNSI